MLRLAFAVPFTLFATAAPAALVVNITGAVGDGFSTITLSGSSTIDQAGTIRTSSGNTFDRADTLEVPNDLVVNDVIQDQIVGLSGTASLSINGKRTSLSSLFVDDDGTGAFAFDDFGFRTVLDVATNTGDTISFSGSSILNLDISAFRNGFSESTAFFSYFVSPGEASISVTHSAPSDVPIPASLPALALGLGVLAPLARKRKS